MLYMAADQDQPDSWCCVPTTASMIVDASTAGVKRPPVEALRADTGIPHPLGISYGSIAGAVEHVSNVQLQPRYGLTRSEVVNLANSGRPFGISVEMSRLGYSQSGGHTIFVATNGYSVWPGGETCACEKRTNVRHSEYRIQDPGTWRVGYKQISADRLHGAAEARTGGNGINVLVGLDTTDVRRKAVAKGACRKSPSTKANPTRAIQVGKVYEVQEIVEGEPWWRKNGGRSTAWYLTGAGDFIRGDKLGGVNA